MKLIAQFTVGNTVVKVANDGKRFTLAWAQLNTTDASYNQFGYAIRSYKDEPNDVIGCLVALHRLCDNMQLSRDERKKVFNAFEDAIYEPEEE